MKNGFCLVGITLILAGLIMSYQNMENGKFKTFNNLLDNEQKMMALDFITYLTIDRLVLNLSPIEINPLVSFGKHEPP